MFVQIKIINCIASNANSKYFTTKVGGFVGPTENPVAKAIGFDDPSKPFLMGNIETEAWYRTNSSICLGVGDIFNFSPNPQGVYMQDINLNIDLEVVAIEPNKVTMKLLNVTDDDYLDNFQISFGGVESVQVRALESDTFDIYTNDIFRFKRDKIDDNYVDFSFIIQKICVGEG